MLVYIYASSDAQTYISYSERGSQTDFRQLSHNVSLETALHACIAEVSIQVSLPSFPDAQLASGTYLQHHLLLMFHPQTLYSLRRSSIASVDSYLFQYHHVFLTSVVCFSDLEHSLAMGVCYGTGLWEPTCGPGQEVPGNLKQVKDGCQWKHLQFFTLLERKFYSIIHKLFQRVF